MISVGICMWHCFNSIYGHRLKYSLYVNISRPSQSITVYFVDPTLRDITATLPRYYRTFDHHSRGNYRGVPAVPIPMQLSGLSLSVCTCHVGGRIKLKRWHLGVFAANHSWRLRTNFRILVDIGLLCRSSAQEITHTPTEDIKTNIVQVLKYGSFSQMARFINDTHFKFGSQFHFPTELTADAILYLEKRCML